MITHREVIQELENEFDQLHRCIENQQKRIDYLEHSFTQERITELEKEVSRLKLLLRTRVVKETDGSVHFELRKYSDCEHSWQ